MAHKMHKIPAQFLIFLEHEWKVCGYHNSALKSFKRQKAFNRNFQAIFYAEFFMFFVGFDKRIILKLKALRMHHFWGFRVFEHY